MSCGVFFNLDDTLTTRTREFEEIYRDAVEEAGLDAMADRYDDYTEQFFNYFRSHWAYPRRQAMDRLVRDRDDYDPEKVEQFVAAWEELEADALELKPGVKETLRKLAQDYPLGVITNGTGRLQRLKLEKLGIDDLFSAVIVSTEEGVRKPEKLIFLAGKNTIEADEYVMVSHLPKRDIVAARQAGFQAVWLADTDKQMPDEVGEQIRDITELPGVLEKLCGE